MGQFHLLQEQEPAEHQPPVVCVKPNVLGWGNVNPTVLQMPLDDAVQGRKPLGLDLLGLGQLDFLWASLPQKFGSHLRRPVTDSIRYILPGNDQIGPVRLPAAQENVGMRVVGVVVIDSNPLQLGVQIPFHPAHHLPHISRHVGDVSAAFRGDDQPEVMPVFRPLDGLLPGVYALSRGVIEDAVLAIGAGAFSPQIGDVTAQAALRFARPVVADVRLDDYSLPPAVQRRTV